MSDSGTQTDQPSGEGGVAAHGGRLKILVVPASSEPKAYLRTIDWAASDGGANLQALQGLVDGYIEALTITEDAIALLNEDGKALELVPNLTATRLTRAAGVGLFADDYLAGQVVFVGTLNAAGEEDGATHDAPRSVLDLCQRAGIEVVDQTAAPA